MYVCAIPSKNVVNNCQIIFRPKVSEMKILVKIFYQIGEFRKNCYRVGLDLDGGQLRLELDDGRLLLLDRVPALGQPRLVFLRTGGRFN
jgi:hypothetical protein